MEFSRRDFLKGTIAALVASSFPDAAHGEEAGELNKAHEPLIRVPKVAQDGRVVPVTVDLSGHPMEEDHYIKSIEIFDMQSKTPDRGRAVLTPDIGRAFLSTRVKMPDGKHNIKVVIECSKHGRFESAVTMSVVGGQCKEV
jgi:desulfoferrodoxin (superoxide reductase-like protein)